MDEPAPFMTLFDLRNNERKNGINSSGADTPVELIRLTSPQKSAGSENLIEEVDDIVPYEKDVSNFNAKNN